MTKEEFGQHMKDLNNSATAEESRIASLLAIIMNNMAESSKYLETCGISREIRDGMTAYILNRTCSDLLLDGYINEALCLMTCAKQEASGKTVQEFLYDLSKDLNINMEDFFKR